MPSSKKSAAGPDFLQEIPVILPSNLMALRVP
jgi:hypothetical protein